MAGYQRTLTRRFASPSGGGSGASVGSPGTIADFWTWCLANPTLMPNSWLILADGTYTGLNAMIRPSAGVTGKAAGGYVHVKTTTDGGALIDGEYARNPCQVQQNNDYIWIEGMDIAHSVNSSIVNWSGNNGVVRRVVAYDLPIDQNAHGFQFSGGSSDDATAGTGNLIEDCAAFGIMRKGFEQFQSHGNTFRRIFSVWNGSTQTGPKRCFQPNYHSNNAILDNAFFRFDGRMIPSSPWTIMNNGVEYDPGGPGVCGTGNTQLNGQSTASTFGCQAAANKTDSTAGGMGEEAYTGGVDTQNAGDTLSGVLGVVTSTDLYNSSNPSGAQHGFVNPQTWGGITLRDSFIYIPSGVTDRNNTANAPIAHALWNIAAGPASTATNITSIAAGTDISGASWTITNRLTGTSLSALGAETLYTGTTGAKLRYRYKDSVLTTEPLWPWPMKQRIYNATLRATSDGHGHVAEDVDAIRISIFGKSPDEP